MLEGISTTFDKSSVAVSYFTGALSAKNSSFPTFAICFIVGSVYLAIGLGIAMAKRKKHTP